MVDAADLKSASRKRVGVRVPSWAPFLKGWIPIFPFGVKGDKTSSIFVLRLVHILNRSGRNSAHKLLFFVVRRAVFGDFAPIPI